MSFTDSPSMRIRSRTKTSWVLPGQIATLLPRRSLIARMSESFLAITAMPRLQVEAMTTSGSPAAAPSVAAAMPKVPKSTDLVTTAFLHSVGLSKGTTSTVTPAGVKRS
jgi:hypothetical protein